MPKTAAQIAGFLAKFDPKMATLIMPGASGVLCIHDGVTLFAGAATVPE